MRDFLSKFTPVEGGTLSRNVTREWMNAVQDAIRALANGENITLGQGLGKSPGDGRFSLHGGRRVATRRRGGGALASYIPWEPNFFTAGTTTTPIYKCRFNLGTVNDVPASNWNDEHVLSMAADAFSFVVLTITTGSGKVTTVNLSVDTAAPVEDSIASGTPPVTFKIVLGAIGRSTAKMIVNKNIELSATEVFRESKTAPATGQEPFTRWWRWGNR